MIKVSITKQGNYPVSVPKLKKAVKETLSENGIISNSLVEVFIVGEKLMLQMSAKYLKEKYKLHDILTFPEKETKGEFKYPEGGLMRLGQIYLCYPEIINDANRRNKLIDDVAKELVQHGVLHLLGIHHE